MKINKQSISIIFIIIALFICCNVKEDKSPKVKADSKDSNPVQSDLKRKEIDSIMALGDRPDDEQESPNIADERKQFIKSYENIIRIDTLLIDGNDSLNLSAKYYCLKNRNLVIPKNYVFEEKNLKDFITHPFACDVKLVRNKKTVFEKTIQLINFDPLLSEQLKKYAVLSKPYLPKYQRETGDVILDFSISIPVTDIGIGVNLKIKKDGSFTVSKD